PVRPRPGNRVPPMSAGLEIPVTSLDSFSPAHRSDAVRDRVRLVVSSAQPHRQRNERRHEKRYPFPFPIHLLPVDMHGEPTGEEPIVVLGKNISEQGLDFYYSEPVSFRRVIASLPCGPERWTAFHLDLTWCRFSGCGWYENGGKFLQCADSPLGET